MSMIDTTPVLVNPSSNPRDSWPSWTDTRWTLAPEQTNPLDSPAFLAKSLAGRIGA